MGAPRKTPLRVQPALREKHVFWNREQNACEWVPVGLIRGISRPSMKGSVSVMRGLKPLRIHGDSTDLWAFEELADIGKSSSRSSML